MRPTRAASTPTPCHTLSTLTYYDITPVLGAICAQCISRAQSDAMCSQHMCGCSAHSPTHPPAHAHPPTHQRAHAPTHTITQPRTTRTQRPLEKTRVSSMPCEKGAGSGRGGVDGAGEGEQTRESTRDNSNSTHAEQQHPLLKREPTRDNSDSDMRQQQQRACRATAPFCQHPLLFAGFAGFWKRWDRRRRSAGGQWRHSSRGLECLGLEGMVEGKYCMVEGKVRQCGYKVR